MTWPLIEWAWTLLAGAAVVVALFNLIDALGDARALAASGANGLRKIVAQTSVRTAVPLVVGPAAFAAMGALALRASDPANAPSINSLLFIGGLALASGAFAAASVAITIGRRNAIAYIDRAELEARIAAARRDRRSTDKPKPDTTPPGRNTGGPPPPPHSWH